jgi:hypothetical protein
MKATIIDRWEIECCECNTPNIIRVDSLEQIRRKRQNIVCVGCKHGKKVDNFLTKNEMTFVQSYNDGNILIECDDCKLQYYYTGNYFDNYRCYCKMIIKRDEHVIYKHLHDNYPSACITKEYLYHNKHKIDIRFDIGDKIFLIEIDDDSHFSTGKSCAIDIDVMKEFLKRNDDNIFFIRIPTNAVNHDDTLVILDDFIETVQNNNPRILLFQVGPGNRYQFHDIPDEACEIGQVTQI